MKFEFKLKGMKVLMKVRAGNIGSKGENVKVSGRILGARSRAVWSVISISVWISNMKWKRQLLNRWVDYKL